MATLKVTRICEHDIDLLLLEEFAASPTFLGWFLRQIEAPSSATLLAAAQSVSTTTGESDLELTLQGPSGIFKVLIENKVGALLQPRQQERYRERGDNYISGQGCESFVTTILAPQAYFRERESTLGFDHRVTYEALLDWFLKDADLGIRGEYKCMVLREAIQRQDDGWLLVPSAAATSFWVNYWDLANDVAPELRMPQPTIRPATCNFIRFDPVTLPSEVWLRHGLPSGIVQLLFRGQASKLDGLRRLFGRKLTPTMLLARAAGSAAIGISIPGIDQSAPFSSAEPVVREALSTALELLAWYNSNVLDARTAT